MSKIAQAGATAVKGLARSPPPLGGGPPAGGGPAAGVAGGAADQTDAGRPTYVATLALTLRALAHMRAGGRLLHGPEWAEYAVALTQGWVAPRPWM